MPPVAIRLDSGFHGGCGDFKMLACECDLLFGPQSAYQPHEFLGTGVAVRLVALAVAIGGQVVLSRYNVDAHAAAAQMIQCGRSGCEMCGPPIARADCDE